MIGLASLNGNLTLPAANQSFASIGFNNPEVIAFCAAVPREDRGDLRARRPGSPALPGCSVNHADHGEKQQRQKKETKRTHEGDTPRFMRSYRQDFFSSSPCSIL